MTRCPVCRLPFVQTGGHSPMITTGSTDRGEAWLRIGPHRAKKVARVSFHYGCAELLARLGTKENLELIGAVLKQAEEHHPRPHYVDPPVPCGGPGSCVDEVRFADLRKILEVTV